jgi:hypothetical protein
MPPQRLITREAGYLLRVGRDELDSDKFEDLLRRARLALDAGAAPEAARMLRTALELWRGPAFGDFTDEPFVQSEAARLEELRLVAAETRITADLAVGRHVELIGELEALTRDYPLREGLRAQLMTALYRSGRQADALRVYRDVRELLIDQLGVEPSSDLQRLERAILRQDADLAWVGPHSTPASLDAPSAVEGTPGVRPGPDDERIDRTFVGRRAQLSILLRALDAAQGGRGQLVLIAGEPGIGKTRIARELAEAAFASSVTVAWGRVWEGEGAPAFWPWVQLLRALLLQDDREALRILPASDASVVAQLVPEIADCAPPLPRPAQLSAEQARFQLFDVTIRLLRRISAERTLMVILDDLHWADTSSLLLLRFLARELVDMPLLLLGTYRDVGTEPMPAWPSTLAELLSEPVTRRRRPLRQGGDGRASRRR